MFTDQQNLVIQRMAAGESLATRAVAGSGKTTTMTAGIASISTDGIALAFNKKNAEDLNASIKARAPGSRVEAKTLNALGHRVWMDHIGKRVSVDMDKTKNIIKELNIKTNSIEEWTAICKLVSIAKARAITTGKLGTNPADLDNWKNGYEESGGDSDMFTLVVERALTVLSVSSTQAFQGKIDFDDQLYMPVVFNARFPSYNFVSVDEAQDLSPLQHEMVARLNPKQIVVVGDPNQAIYAFRGASSSSFEELVERFELPELPLTLSFRCPKSVAEIAKRYVPDFSVPETAIEGRVIHTQDSVLAGMMLCRYNAPLLRKAFEALRQRKSVNYLGRDFLAGIKNLNAKYPTQQAVMDWAKTKSAEAKTKGARQRVEDQLASLLTLHDVSKRESTTVEAIITDLLRQGKLGATLTLATVHKAKGLEFPTVTFLGFSEELEGGQEDNISYVGVTRAQNTLYLQKKDW
jgi:DNA helicase II / ATP-dependent DNA helicase PcrA